MSFSAAPARAGNPSGFPARAGNLAGLPPAYVTATEFDPLRDEGIAYAVGLLAADVSTELHVLPGGFRSVGCPSALSRREPAEETVVLTRALYA